ncbi:hypothetical protein DFJ73DRAFT_167629 [Zopfochytrium polystomum]|nr:hypothetical protein DFJ73DRAFT_167629 [Zopfochytrium polystomum]
MTGNDQDRTGRDFADFSPQELLEAMTPSQRKSLQRRVLGKYFRNGIFTTFKGKNQLRVFHAKVSARREIERVLEAIKAKETDLHIVEENLAASKVHLAESKLACTNALEEMKSIASTEPPLKTIFGYPSHQTSDTSSRAFFEDSDFLHAQIPSSPRLTNNRRFRALCAVFSENRDVAIHAIDAIAQLEEAIIPLQHDLSALQLQEARLHGLEQRLLESDVRQMLEDAVLAQLKEDRHEKLLAAWRRREDEERRLQEESEREEMEEKRRKGVIMAEKRKKMRMRLQETVSEINRRDEEKRAALDGQIERKHKALLDLRSHVEKSLARIAEERKTARSSDDARESVSDKPSLLKMFEGGNFDLTETPNVRKTRLSIIEQKMADAAADRERQQQIEMKKMAILGKIIAEEDTRRRREKAERLLKDTNRVLESLAPTELEAFPVVGPKPKVLHRPKARVRDEVDDWRRRLENEPTPEATEARNTQSADSSRQRKTPVAAPRPLLTWKDHKPPTLAGADDRSSLASLRPPFTSQPSRVVFADYDPEKVYTATALLTNTSYRANSFKLLPIPVDFASYFEVKVPPPGRMSAGMVSEVKFIFRPPAGYDQDIDAGQVSFQAECGGVFAVGVACFSRKCQPRVAAVGGKGRLTEKIDQDKGAGDTVRNRSKQTVLVDFGATVLGGKVSRFVDLTNDGSLPASFTIVPIDEEVNEKDQESHELVVDKVEIDRFFRLPKKGGSGTLGDHSTSKLFFNFEPVYSTTGIIESEWAKQLEAGRYHVRRTFRIDFDRREVPPIFIECSGEINDTPLTIDNSTIDFGICVAGGLYRERLLVMNSSNIALKFWVELAHSQGQKNRDRANDRSNTDSQSRDSDTAKTENFSCIASDGIDSDADESHSDRLIVSSFSSLFVPGEPARENSVVHFLSRAPSSIKAPPPEKHAPKRVIKKKSGQTRSDSLCVQVSDVGEVEISPRLAFAQPGEPFSVWIKVRPTRAAYILLQNGELSFRLPLVVKFVNQSVESPIALAISGSITITDLTFTSHGTNANDISFGECSIYEYRDMPLEISNHSSLPQILRFTSSNSTFFVVPDMQDRSGIVILPPASTVMRSVRFEPSQSGRCTGRLMCHSNWGRKFEVICHGVGYRPRLRFSVPDIKFGATGYGSFVQATVSLIRDAPVVRSKKHLNGEGGVQSTEPDNRVDFQFGKPVLVSVHSKKSMERAFSESERIRAMQQDAAIQAAKNCVTRAGGFIPTVFDKENIQRNVPAQNMESPSRIFSQRPASSGSARAKAIGKIDAHAMFVCDELAAVSSVFDLPDIRVEPQTGSLKSPAMCEVQICVSLPDVLQLQKFVPASPETREDEVSGLTDGLVEEGKKREGADATPHRPVSADPEVNKKKDSVEPKEGSKPDTNAEKSRPVTARKVECNFFRPKTAPEPAEKPLESPSLRRLYDKIDDAYLSAIIPCKVFKDDGRDNDQAHGADPPSEFGPRNMTYLRVHMPIVMPLVVLLDPLDGELSFAATPVKFSETRSVVLFNPSQEPIEITIVQINQSSPFELFKQRVPISSKEQVPVQISFSPSEEGVFTDELLISCLTTHLKVKLRGQGTIPTVTFDAFADNEVCFDDVVVGDTVTKPIRVHNPSPFPVDIVLELATNPYAPGSPTSPSHSTQFRRNPFSVYPLLATIPPLADHTAVVVFEPEHESDAVRCDPRRHGPRRRVPPRPPREVLERVPHRPGLPALAAQHAARTPAGPCEI